MYRVIQGKDVLEQVAALPAAALPHYAEVLTVLGLEPAGGRPYNLEKPHGPMRQLVFGAAGEGIVTYLLLEREREVHVLSVLWGA